MVRCRRRGLVLAVPLVLIFAVPVRVRGSDLPPRHRGPPRLPDRSRATCPVGSIFVASVAWLAGGLLPSRRAGSRRWRARRSVRRRSPPRFASPGHCRDDRGARRPRRRRSDRRPVRRAAAGVPVRRARHAGGRGDDLQHYARRGYFELVAAAALAGGILVVLEYQVLARTRAYVALAIGLVGADRSSCSHRRRCACSSIRTPTGGRSCACTSRSRSPRWR